MSVSPDAGSPLPTTVAGMSTSSHDDAYRAALREAFARGQQLREREILAGLGALGAFTGGVNGVQRKAKDAEGHDHASDGRFTGPGGGGGGHGGGGHGGGGTPPSKPSKPLNLQTGPLGLHLRAAGHDWTPEHPRHIVADALEDDGREAEAHKVRYHEGPLTLDAGGQIRRGNYTTRHVENALERVHDHLDEWSGGQYEPLHTEIDPDLEPDFFGDGELPDLDHADSPHHVTVAHFAEGDDPSVHRPHYSELGSHLADNISEDVDGSDFGWNTDGNGAYSLDDDNSERHPDLYNSLGQLQLADHSTANLHLLQQGVALDHDELGRAESEARRLGDNYADRANSLSYEDDHDEDAVRELVDQAEAARNVAFHINGIRNEMSERQNHHGFMFDQLLARLRTAPHVDPDPTDTDDHRKAFRKSWDESRHPRAGGKFARATGGKGKAKAKGKGKQKGKVKKLRTAPAPADGSHLHGTAAVDHMQRTGKYTLGGLNRSFAFTPAQRVGHAAKNILITAGLTAAVAGGAALANRFRPQGPVEHTAASRAALTREGHAAQMAGLHPAKLGRQAVNAAGTLLNTPGAAGYRPGKKSFAATVGRAVGRAATGLGKVGVKVGRAVAPVARQFAAGVRAGAAGGTVRRATPVAPKPLPVAKPVGTRLASRPSPKMANTANTPRAASPLTRPTGSGAGANTTRMMAYPAAKPGGGRPIPSVQPTQANRPLPTAKPVAGRFPTARPVPVARKLPLTTPRPVGQTVKAILKAMRKKKPGLIGRAFGAAGKVAGFAGKVGLGFAAAHAASHIGQRVLAGRRAGAVKNAVGNVARAAVGRRAVPIANPVSQKSLGATILKAWEESKHAKSNGQSLIKAPGGGKKKRGKPKVSASVLQTLIGRSRHLDRVKRLTPLLAASSAVAGAGAGFLLHGYLSSRQKTAATQPSATASPSHRFFPTAAYPAKKSLGATVLKAWEESKHKRDHGKFSSTGGARGKGKAAANGTAHGTTWPAHGAAPAPARKPAKRKKRAKAPKGNRWGPGQWGVALGAAVGVTAAAAAIARNLRMARDEGHKLFPMGTPGSRSSISPAKHAQPKPAPASAHSTVDGTEGGEPAGRPFDSDLGRPPQVITQPAGTTTAPTPDPAAEERRAAKQQQRAALVDTTVGHLERFQAMPDGPDREHHRQVLAQAMHLHTTAEIDDIRKRLGASSSKPLKSGAIDHLLSQVAYGGTETATPDHLDDTIAELQRHVARGRSASGHDTRQAHMHRLLAGHNFPEKKAIAERVGAPSKARDHVTLTAGIVAHMLAQTPAPPTTPPTEEKSFRKAWEESKHHRNHGQFSSADGGGGGGGSGGGEPLQPYDGPPPRRQRATRRNRQTDPAQHAGFHAAIHANQDDHLPKKVYADFLEETDTHADHQTLDMLRNPSGEVHLHPAPGGKWAAKTYPHLSMADIKRRVTASGHRYFSRENIRYFGARTEPKVHQGDGGTYFVQSIDNFDGTGRMWKVTGYDPVTHQILSYHHESGDPARLRNADGTPNGNLRHSELVWLPDDFGSREGAHAAAAHLAQHGRLPPEHTA